MNQNPNQQYQQYRPNQQYQQYPQYPQQYPGQQYPPQRNPNDGQGKSIAGLVLGIVSLVIGFAGVGLVLGIVGIVLAVMGRKASMACYGKPSGIATAGFILSIIGTVFGGITFVACGLPCLCAAGAGTAGLGCLPPTYY